MKTQVFIVPGLFDSGPDHWQSWWTNKNTEFKRVVQDNWETPDAKDWIERLNEEVDKVGDEVVLIGHSLSCNLVGLWAEKYKWKVKGALLVAPSDTESSYFPDVTIGFKPMSKKKLPFPSIVVASTNDPWVSTERAAFFAQNWGSEFITVGEKGHINADSKLGMWEEGLEILQKLL